MIGMTESARPARHGRRRVRRRARLSPLTVFGELLLLGGLGVLGYMIWQPWYTGFVVQGQQNDLAAEESDRWRQAAESEEQPSIDGIPVVDRPEPGDVFANLYVPAFGETFSNRITYSTEQYIIDSGDHGIGQYDVTQMPGEPGNFAIAAHRNGPIIAPFREVMNLRIGDGMFIETPKGWYTYRFRDLEYVWPDEFDVTNPFPRLDGTSGEDQILTLTTCHPKWAGSEERAIAYAVLEDFQPLSEGPPAELAEQNPNVEGA